MNIVIPSVPDPDDFTITVEDGKYAWITASDAFEVDGLSSVKATPSYGPQGSTIEVHGYNFTQLSGKDVVVTLDGQGKRTFETNAAGEFEGTFNIPAVDYGDRPLDAVQAGYKISATRTFRVGLMLTILTPSTGATGTLVSITGVGFTDNDDYNATMDGVLVAEGTASPTGTISDTFYCPTLDVGTYTVTVLDIAEDIEVTAEFTVTATTMAEADPPVAPNDYNVTLSGKYFAAFETESIEFIIQNATDYWTMTVEVWDDVALTMTDVELDADGNFTGYWVVPPDDTLSLGEYTINVTDGQDLFAQIPFTIVSEALDIEGRKASFSIGNNVAFNIEASFAQLDSYIKIWDPADNLYWQTDLLTSEKWIKVGVVYLVPYYRQTAGGNFMLLEDDAPLGTWTWTYFDKDGDEIDTGSFTVTPAPEAVLEEKIGELDTKISDLTADLGTLVTDVSALANNVQTLAGAVADATAAANAATSAANEALDAVEDIAAVAGSAASAAENAATAASEAKTAAEEAGRAASGLSTLVYGAIGASLIAALAAIVSLMQISRRIAG
jgi:hypothetical protein